MNFRRIPILLVIVLAALWPVLLLAFAAAWLSNRADKPPSKKP